MRKKENEIQLTMWGIDEEPDPDRLEAEISAILRSGMIARCVCGSKAYQTIIHVEEIEHNSWGALVAAWSSAGSSWFKLGAVNSVTAITKRAAKKERSAPRANRPIGFSQSPKTSKAVTKPPHYPGMPGQKRG